MKLINGKGQLGEALKKADIKGDWTIYHTWDFENKKDLEIQRDCYRKFVKYVDTHPKEKIVFISTLSQGESFYTRFKRLAEVYLRANGEGKIIRICSIIGKGTYQGFRENKLEASGDMEIVTLSYVIEKIIRILNNTEYTDREYEIHGDRIPAHIVKELILFGKNGKATQ